MKLRIVQDELPPSPREWDTNLGTMVCWNRNYDLGDEQPSESPDEFRKELPKNTIILPLYLLDHSGITVRTFPFSCPWDSGQLGWIYTTREKIRKEYKVKQVSRKLRERVEQALESEVKVYDQHLRGAVWGFQLGTPCSECGKEKVEDSCWGFFGDTLEETGIADHLSEEFLPLLEEAWEGRGEE